MSFRSVRAAAMAGAAIVLTSTAASAATATADNTEVVVVTGSLISGAAEQAALPVTVLGADDIQKRGTPSMVELIKALPSSGAVYGDANQFTAGRTEGVSSVNLRGLSASRTLVLFNGRRIAQSAASPLLPLVDLNMFPAIAIGRLEVLKDGAAATYGSEAIGGVVNVITKTNVQGLQLTGDYKHLEGSDGDYNAGALWGYGDDNANIMLAAGYNHQSTLPATARNFAAPSYTTEQGALNALQMNPAGGWSGGSMANYIAPGVVRDPACDQDWSGMADTALTPALGGAAATGPAGASGSAAGRCYWRFADFDNLVEDTDKFQGYGEVNFTFHDGIKFHLEGLYGQTNVHNVPGSVTYLPAQNPGPFGTIAGFTPGTGPASGNGDSKRVAGTGFTAAQLATSLASANFYIPNQNPGLATLRTLFPTAPITAGSTALGGVFAGALIWRPLGIGGNPLFCDRDSRCPALGQREQDTYRVSASLDGGLPWLGSDTHWTVAGTMSESHAMNNTPDMLVDRLQLALEGLGSKTGETACNPNIAGNAGSAAAHCYYLNPFSTGIASNKITGATNPNFAAALALDPRVVNTGALVDWIYGGEKDSQFTEFENQEMVFDAVVSGTLPWKLWGSDPVAWAVGSQFRKDTYSSKSSAFTNNGVTPCIDTILNGDHTCAGHNGPFGFYGNYVDTHFSGETKSVFGELDIPVTDDIQVQAAARYEQIYGGSDTFNPKVSVRWQALDWFALRGSVGTTFRAPTLGNLSPNAVTVLAVAPVTSAYTPFDTFGNGGKPAGTIGLDPEKATSFNLGGIVTLGNFTATVDYWHFDFSNPLGSESAGAILTAIFPNGAAGANNCANAAYTALIARVTFANGACAATVGGVNNVARVHVNFINNGPQQTHGIDLSAQYVFDDVVDGGDVLTARLDGTYNINYRVSAQTIEGIKVFNAYDAAGGLNVGLLGPASLPHVKGAFNLNWADGPFNIRGTMNIVGGMRDFNNPSRAATFVLPQDGFCNPAALPATVPPCVGRFSTAGASVAPWITWDLNAQYIWEEQNLQFNLSIDNILDKQPPFARTDYSYDAFTANPYGRTIKFGVTANVN
jgi:iron complex outermembrane receptor protein